MACEVHLLQNEPIYDVRTEKTRAKNAGMLFGSEEPAIKDVFAGLRLCCGRRISGKACALIIVRSR